MPEGSLFATFSPALIICCLFENTILTGKVIAHCLSRSLVAKSCLTLVTPWTIACQAPLSLGFSRQDYWSRLPFLSESHTNAIFIPVQGTVLSMTVNLKMIVKWTEEYDLPKSNSFIFIGLIFIFLMKPLSLANEIIDSLIN